MLPCAGETAGDISLAGYKRSQTAQIDAAKGKIQCLAGIFTAGVGHTAIEIQYQIVAVNAQFIQDEAQRIALPADKHFTKIQSGIPETVSDQKKAGLRYPLTGTG
jgi:hypothetical protein